MALIFSTVFFILSLISRLFIFQKYGEESWKGLIPFYSDYLEYKHCWTGDMGIVAIILGIVSELNIGGFLALLIAVVAIAELAVNAMFCYRKSLCFGGGMGMCLLLLFFPFIGNLVLGFNDNYVFCETCY